jgi:hypothetical protein
LFGRGSQLLSSTQYTLWPLSICRCVMADNRGSGCWADGLLSARSTGHLPEGDLGGLRHHFYGSGVFRSCGPDRSTLGDKYRSKCRRVGRPSNIE